MTTEFSYGVQDLTVQQVFRPPDSDVAVVSLSNGVCYGSQCFRDAEVGDVYRVRIVEGAALGNVVEGLRISKREGEP